MSRFSLELKNEELHLQGRLCFDTTAQAYKMGLPFFKQQPSLVLNLSDLTHIDSSALCCLTAWIRAANDESCQLRLKEIPKKLFDLARVSGLDDVLPLVD